MMHAPPTRLDVDLDAIKGREYAGPGVWILSPAGSLSWQQITEDALRKQSILIRAGGRIFVNADGGAASKAGRGFAILEVGVNCTAEELAPLEEWRQQAERGESPLPLPADRLPRAVLERRVGSARRDAQRLEQVPPPDTEEAARLFSNRIKRAKTRLAQLESTIEARTAKRAVQAGKSA